MKATRTDLFQAPFSAGPLGMLLCSVVGQCGASCYQVLFATSLCLVKLTKGCVFCRRAVEGCIEKLEETRRCGIRNSRLNYL